MTATPRQPRHRRGTPPAMPILPRDRYDADLADSAADHEAIDGLTVIAERSAYLIDDAVNAVEASEERTAAQEAQAMR